MAQLKITNGFEGMADLDFLGKVRFVVQQITGNSNFSTPDPTLASVTTLANQFEQAINDAEAGGSYDKSVRDSRKEELIDTMHNLSNYVLFTAKGDRLIAESSGFTIAKDRSPQPPIEKPEGLNLTDGLNAGELLLLFLRVVGARSYSYQISLDPTDETKWLTLHGTVRKNLFTGLESGKKYYVRVIAIGIGNQIVYSDTVSRVAQ
jgi:hypothetical protein